MKILKTDNNTLNRKVINEAINVLAHGGIVLYPTDTVYGLGVNIFDETAIKKLYKIKKRDFFKPFSILVSDVEAISHVAKISLNDMKFIEEYLPGPYTFILEKTHIVPYIVTSGLKQVGVRVPDNKIARTLAELFPITTTSANMSHKEVLSTPEEIINQLGRKVDLVIDVGKLESNTPSTLIDLTKAKPQVLKRV